MTTLPELFRQRIAEQIPEEAEAFLEALQTEPSVAVRTNRRKSAQTPATDPVPWCAEGRYLGSRPQFTFDPLLHAGCYYVQDASSMFLSQVIRQLASNAPVTYLDLCAAPGGKTTTAIDALPDGSLVVANEIDGRRAQILRENAIKWGYPGTIVTNSDAHHLGRLQDAFDIIAADMPCSGEGMFRKDEEAVTQWTPQLVEQCADRQREIAEAIWPALKPGGIFIYSTCTFNLAENEEMVKFLIEELGAEAVEVDTDPAWHIHPAIGTDLPCYRFMPHLTRGEGLFVAVVRKAGEYAETSKPSTKKEKNRSKATAKPAVCPDWIVDADNYELTADADIVSAVPKPHAALAKQVRKAARTLLCGIETAQTKGHDLVPAHALSQSTALRKDAFPTAELDYTSAIAYLRGEVVTLPDGMTRGFVVVTYHNAPLGFVKNIGNRANNLYPKEWRIRSGFVPSEPPEVLADK